MPKRQFISKIALVVKDYDEAIKFYTEKLDFELVEDTPMTAVKRWVVLCPPGAKECHLLLAKAKNQAEAASIGSQTGGRVFLFLYTDDFWRDYHEMVEKGINFVRPPVEEAWGIVSVFEDLYGNLWDFIQPKS